MEKYRVPVNNSFSTLVVSKFTFFKPEENSKFVHPCIMTYFNIAGHTSFFPYHSVTRKHSVLPDYREVKKN